MAYWKQIVGLPDYEITTLGRVWSWKTGKFLKQYLTGISGKGYLTVRLYKNSCGIDKKVHKLVLEAFVSSCPKGMEACHNNGDRLDNRLENLRWGTRSSNIKDAIKHSTASCLRRGEDSTNHKLTERDVLEIRRLWWDMLQTMKDITKLYNVHYSTINRIINRRIWKHI
ncbi:hypothetical protein LCGC14_0404110 [marine sediment metagenome]|uniref:HNH nuclease domain-containing protein n=1 Tax=marine sediment metagenome TaxID=412755 RepID=A0A0F9TDV8_9ZZZZ